MFRIGKYYADKKGSIIIKIVEFDLDNDRIKIVARDKTNYSYNCTCRLSFDLSKFAWVLFVPVKPWRGVVKISERQIVPGNIDLF